MSFIAPAPTLLTADILVAAIASDFAARGITAQCLVGEWESERHRGSPRVIGGRGRFGVTDPAGKYQPGAVWDNGDGTVSRALFARVQDFPIWCYAPAPAGTASESIPKEARRQTAALVDRTLAALRRANGGRLTAGQGEWPSEARGGAVYGGLAKFVVTFPVPVLDDPLAEQVATQTAWTSTYSMPEGSTPPETTTG